MQPLQIYKQFIESQPTCNDSWFGPAIAKYRKGDDMAGREISASCLRLALEIAEQRAADFSNLSVLDLAQEGNVGLMDALKTFQGGSAKEFVQHARQAINQRLQEIEALS